MSCGNAQRISDYDFFISFFNTFLDFSRRRAMQTRPTPELIEALRKTAKRMSSIETRYLWSHQGSCNCGHLAQTLTSLSQAEIHSYAIERHGDWEDHAEDYCPTSGHHIDRIITTMMEIGMTRDDIGYLEKLDSPTVLQCLPLEQRNMSRSNRDDVVLYMNTWATMLEEQLLSRIQLPTLNFEQPSLVRPVAFASAQGFSAVPEVAQS
jgi:hypothetical protein